MADTCIEKTNDFPALGAGNVNVYENELIEAPEEEEEFDLMNDETFGDIAEDVEFDWEEEHEKLAVDLEKHHPINYSGNNTTDSGFHTTEKNYASQEEYMEQSLSRLVVDDEDVEETVGLNAKKARSIPRKMQSLDELFGPASPPSFLDTERLVRSFDHLCVQENNFINSDISLAQYA